MKKENASDLYHENYELLSQIGSVIQLVIEDLVRIEFKDNTVIRKSVDRCYAALTMLPDKINRLELISDKRSLLEK